MNKSLSHLIHSRKVIKTLFKYFILEKRENEMFITPVEKEWKNEGIKEGIKEGIEKGEAQGIKKGSMETQTKMFFQLVNALQKENTGITKNEAIERAKQIFELDEIPELS